MDRASSATALLARLGFAEPGRAAGLLADPLLIAALGGDADGGLDLADAMAEVPDPDLAALGVVRLLEALKSRGMPSADLPADVAIRPTA